MDPVTVGLITAALAAASKVIVAVVEAIARGDVEFTEEDKERIRQAHREAVAATEALSRLPQPKDDD